MSSGIYKLTFKDGSVYIGKSSNIDKRWAQHTKAMLKGTHTKKIQDAYYKYGMPKFEVIFECHQDHIDILEGYYINYFWGSNILNTTQPPKLTDSELDLLNAVTSAVWDLSTFEHIDRMCKQANKVSELEGIISSSKNSKLFKRTMEELTSTRQSLQLERNEVARLKNRGFFERLFNL